MITTFENGFEVPPVDHNKTWKSLVALKCLSLAIIGVALPVHATVYYVDIGRGSDSNSGTSQSAAWAHIPGAIGFSGTGWVTIQSGDTILVKGGTTNNYSIQFTTSGYNGTAGYNGTPHFNSILIQSGDLASPAWGTGRAIIDGQNTRTYGVGFGQGSGAALYGITLDGFEIRNIAAGAAGSPWDDQTGSACVEWGANNSVEYITVKRCWLHDANRSVDNTGHGIEFNGYVQYFIVTQNKIGPNIGTKGCEPVSASFGVISNNYFCGTGDHCIALTRSTNVDVCNNMIYYVPPQVHEPTYGIALPSSGYCDVWNNVIFRSTPTTATGSDWTMGIGTYTAAAGGLSISNRIAFNTVAFFGDFGNQHVSTAISLGDYPTGHTNYGLIFQNNLVYSNFNSMGSIQYFVVLTSMSGENVSFNDFYGLNTTENVMDSYSAGDTYSTAAGFSTGAGHTYANNAQLDPKLTGGVLPTGLDANWHPNGAFFQLTTNSPAGVRVTGNALAGDTVHGFNSSPNKFASDIIGTLRTGWSIGAYEAGSGTVVQLPPAPTGLHVISAL